MTHSRTLSLSVSPLHLPLLRSPFADFVVKSSRFKLWSKVEDARGLSEAALLRVQWLIQSGRTVFTPTPFLVFL